MKGYAEGAIGPAASESPGIDYVQVSDTVTKQNKKQVIVLDVDLA